MDCRYLYIDDNTAQNAEGILVGLRKEGELVIDFKNPEGNWEQERNKITSEGFKKYDGLILDLNLEETPNQNKQVSRYKGSSLAQEIRNLSKASEIKEIPVVLLSATVNLARFFDKSSEDLFDLIIERDSIGKQFPIISLQLVALARGYKLIQSWKNREMPIEELFRANLSAIDARFISEVHSFFDLPVHTFSNFVIKQLLNKNGILINEAVLGARLGIDIAKSPSWSKLLEQLVPYQYSGLYYEGWQRWWMRGIDTWWANEIGSPKRLRSMDANKRVELIQAHTKIEDLIPIRKIDKAKSSSFWTVCYGSDVPIDTIDGLLVGGQDNYYPWQDKEYVSIDEALKPTNKKKWVRLSATEFDKLEQLKKFYPNARPPR